MIKTYKAYKVTNFIMLKEIPVEWKLQKLKFIANIYTGDSLNDDYKTLFESEDSKHNAYISSKDINVDTSEVQYENGLRIPIDFGKFKIARSNNALLCIEGGSAGRKMAFLNQDVFFVNKLACFATENPTTSKFIYYCLRSNVFQTQFFNSIAGLIGGVSISNLKNFYLPFPSYNEQTKIIRFLDHQTAIIDELIQRKEKLVELLKEKRQSVINEVVTKGLNPNAKMKDSGIEWLGEIPDEWKVTKSKYITEIITDGAHISPDISSEDFPFISTVDLTRGEIDWHNCLKTSKENYEYLVRTGCKPQTFDVLYSKDGTIGKTTVINEEKDFVVASSLIIIRPKINQVNPYYLEYLLRSSVIGYQIDRLLSGVALRRISLEKFSNLQLILPPLKIQELILGYLQSSNELFLNILDSSNFQIEKLKEYRQSLISEAVTGKIDVRDWEPMQL